jgi:hypothetical protein
LGSPKIGDKDLIIINHDVKAEQKSGRPRTVTPDDAIAKIRKSRLFKTYTESKWSEARAIDLISLLGVYDHTPSREKKNRLELLKTASREVGDTGSINYPYITMEVLSCP